MVISIVCNSRSESGPLESLIAALSPDCVVTRYDATGLGPAVAMAQALTYFTAMFTFQKATRVVVLGDRYETLAAALAAMFLRIPIAHIHGGETTTGAFDDPMRHAITHMADMHFVATEAALDRVLALVEPHGYRCGTADSDVAWYHPRIHRVGAPGLDGVTQGSAKRSEKIILCTYHSETRADDYGLDNCFAMLEALDSLPDHEVMFTPPNADPGSAEIKAAMDMFIRSRDNWHWVDLSHRAYVEMMQVAALVIGNSSAGVIEAPWVGVPSVDIGLRQNGREMATSVRAWRPDVQFTITDAMRWAMTSGVQAEPIYRGGAAAKIAAVLRPPVATVIDDGATYAVQGAKP